VSKRNHEASATQEADQEYISPVIPRGLWWNQFFCSSCGAKVTLVASVANQRQKAEKMYAAHCSNEKCSRNNGGKLKTTLSVSL